MSVGVAAKTGHGVPQSILDMGQEHGIDLSEHRTTSAEDLKLEGEQPWLVCMENFHCSSIEQLTGAPSNTTFLLRQFSKQGSTTRGIVDPFGLSVEFIQSCYNDIKQAVDGMVITLKEMSK